jgi:hypothetical protein
MLALSIIASAPDVPTLTSITLLPPVMRAHPAVPVAPAVALHVFCLAMLPPDAAAQGLAGKVIVANTVPVAASLALAGCEPVRISIVLPAGNCVLYTAAWFVLKVVFFLNAIFIVDLKLFL